VDFVADVLVVGAGLAGLSVAISLSDHGWKTIVVDKGPLGSGASGVPIGLINPAAAKQANLSWNAKSCISSISELLERARPFSRHKYYKKTGVLRPSVDSATLDAFRTSLTRHSYPNGWARWMDTKEVDTFQPGLVHAGGALWLNEGYTVDTSEYLNALKGLCESNGAVFSLNNEIISKSWSDARQMWDLEMSDGQTMRVSHIVNANGASILEDPDWKWLPVHKIKGQMAIYRSESELTWSHAIAGRGYIAHMNDLEWVIGSTFEHTYDDKYPDGAGLRYLEQKVDFMLPELRRQSTLQSQWAGIRVGTPNRLPIVGPHPKLPGLWVFTGLGSKGLLFSSHLGQLLALNMITSTDLPLEVSTSRLSVNI
jgi:glycine oxidase